MRTPDLLGHGTRAADGPAQLRLEDLADAVAADLEAPVDLVVGHSLGAAVALALAARHPGHLRAVVLEDPPGLAAVDARAVADEVEADAAPARADPAGARLRLQGDEPAWSAFDVGNAVANRAALDTARIARFLRTAADWDLPALVASCPVPVGLIAADGPASALLGSDREALVHALAADRVVAIRSGHGVHRERPALWLHAVLGLHERLRA